MVDRAVAAALAAVGAVGEVRPGVASVGVVAAEASVAGEAVVSALVVVVEAAVGAVSQVEAAAAAVLVVVVVASPADAADGGASVEVGRGFGPFDRCARMDGRGGDCRWNLFNLTPPCLKETLQDRKSTQKGNGDVSSHGKRTTTAEQNHGVGKGKGFPEMLHSGHCSEYKLTFFSLYFPWLPALSVCLSVWDASSKLVLSPPNGIDIIANPDVL